MCCFFIGLGLLSSFGDVLFGLNMGVSLPVEMTFFIDKCGMSFGAVVSLISGSVMLFSMYYMDGEVFKRRFALLILFFVAAMYFLLIAGNMITLMVGWDGLGFTSFLLVVYYQSKSSMAAGVLTSLMNRVGDVVFMVALGMMAGLFLFNYMDIVESGVGAMFCFLLVVGSMTKSAQIPFSSWLPAAMAAPTPVSTLVHSSTLVTAGLFVLIRFSGGLEGFFSYLMLGVAACFTCLMAGSCASLEPDLKKVVAFSTLSQLGVMGLALSFGQPDLAFFHLVVHALFKALMFMCVGCVIMISFGVQESRYFSGLYYKMPVTSMWLVVACLSLSGFPFFAGCFSKDLLLESLMGSGMSVFGFFLVYLSCVLTAVYSAKMVFLIFSGDGGQPCSSGEEGVFHYSCTALLGLGSVVGALVFQSVMMNYNIYCSVTMFDKLGIFISVGTGAFCYLFFNLKKVAGALPVEFTQEFVLTMFFLKSLSGSFLSSKFLKLGVEVESMESGVESYIGEGVFRNYHVPLVVGGGMPLHWGVWAFVSYYGVLVGLLSYIMLCA
uniref:NADH-ubiquinone oxidoreductase chain 5 n=1 Tax=Acanthocardia tuberculata TaxID=385555 RepID=Q06SA3_ACATU|nr:NADH dehydrogenase subunit 5 [Acanthocardia tuberculata]ABF60135.1 NADH dehydrogenase subunit 5 [Acanthocardia tuberculata]